MKDYDLSKLVKIGEGRHGAVFLLDQGRCLKIYRKRKYLEMEFKVLELGKRFDIFPRVYSIKGNYMVREYCSGIDAKEYIKRYGLNKKLAIKLIESLEIFSKLGFARIDCRLAHIIVRKNMEIKIIDPTRNMHKKVNFPRQMLGELATLGYKEKFLSIVKEVRPNYYKQWNF